MIFWTTWMFAIILGFICLGAAIERPDRSVLWVLLSYFSMASGVIGSLLGVGL